MLLQTNHWCFDSSRAWVTLANTTGGQVKSQLSPGRKGEPLIMDRAGTANFFLSILNVFGHEPSAIAPLRVAP